MSKDIGNVYSIMSKINKIPKISPSEKGGSTEMVDFISEKKKEIDNLVIEIKRLYSVMKKTGTIPDAKKLNELVTQLCNEMRGLNNGIVDYHTNHNIHNG